MAGLVSTVATLRTGQRQMARLLPTVDTLRKGPTAVAGATTSAATSGVLGLTRWAGEAVGGLAGGIVVAGVASTVASSVVNRVANNVLGAPVDASTAKGWHAHTGPPLATAIELQNLVKAWNC